MKNLIRLLLVSLPVLFGIGCTTTMKPTTNGSSRFSMVDEKNYEIGVEKTVYVGEKLLSRKAYEEVVTKDFVRPSNDFTLSGGIGSVAVMMRGTPNEKFKVVATNDVGNIAVGITGSHLAFGLTPEGVWDGTIASSSFWTAPVGSGSAYKMEPRDTRFMLVESRRPLPEAGYINHELVFSGISEDGIHLLYREYTFENMARSAFTQDLHYTKDAGEVRFRNYRIKLISTTSSSLTYTVLSD